MGLLEICDHSQPFHSIDGVTTMATVNLFRTTFAVGICLILAACASTPRHSPHRHAGYTETGTASYYAMKYQHHKTASGERFNQSAFTAAHRTLPFGTRVRVTNLGNHKSVVVRINDRGPYVRGRIIDLSRAAFSRIGNTSDGVIKVRIRVLK